MAAMHDPIFTVGHSTHPIDVFLDLLQRHDVPCLVDVRRFPGSRRHPQFNQVELGNSLKAAGIRYLWVQELGGRRGSLDKNTPSQNTGLRNTSFRNYADYMATPAFRNAVAQLLADPTLGRTAVMCSEGLFWRCHRRLISDYLLALGVEVRHILPTGKLQSHSLTEGAVVEGNTVSYPGPPSQLSLLE
jgi:uncharacterized protein (DUF488 family)